MGFFSNLFRSRSEVPRGMRATLVGPGTFALPVVGESHYQDALEAVCGPRSDEGEDRVVEAQLVLEDNNPYDSMAVRIDIQGHAVGYLNRRHAREYREQLTKASYPHANAYCHARIRGGWDRGERGKGFYGVYLDLPINQ